MSIKPPPPIPDREPRPGKKTIGNRRTGNSRGINSRRHTIGWAKDPLILNRMLLVEKLWSQGYSTAQMLEPVNEHLQSLGVLPISIRTLKRDKARLLQRFEAEDEGARERHLEALQLVKRRAWDAFENTPSGSLNRSSYLNTLRATEETIAKLDGTFTNKITVEGAVDVRFVAAILADVLVSKLEPDMAEEIITIFNTRVAQAEVIDKPKQ